MREFIDPIDIEFHKKNSIYDNTSDLREDFIVLELGKVMTNNGRYHRMLIHDNNTLSSVIPYRILNLFKPHKYDISSGYDPDLSDIIGYTSELGISVIDGVECIIIKLDENAIININSQLEEDEEFDFTILGKGTIYLGNLLSGGIDTEYLSSVDCIFFNKRKKNEETGI